MKNTSWGKVAGWYDELLENGQDTFQKSVILPNILKTMDLKKGDSLLDIACGQGFFTREFFKTGASVTGVDISNELVDRAREKSPKEISFFVSSADRLPFEKETFDKASIVLAIQNIENVSGAIAEISRILKKGGRAFCVLNHPCFRIPRKSDWSFDDKKGVQYRKIESYMSEIMTKIDMNPGEKDKSKKDYSL